MEIQYLTTQVGVALATGLIQTLLIGGLQLIWQWMSNKFSRVNGGLLFVNRKYYIIISHFILAFVAAGVIYILPEAFSAVLTVAISVGWVLLLLELRRFWSLGLTHTQTKVPLYTYATSLKLSHSDFRLIGVNGFNFCKLVELEGRLGGFVIRVVVFNYYSVIRTLKLSVRLLFSADMRAISIRSKLSIR